MLIWTQIESIFIIFVVNNTIISMTICVCQTVSVTVFAEKELLKIFLIFFYNK